MKPVFSIKYVTERIVPAMVEFEEISGRVKIWDYGDGKFGYYDIENQVKIRHTYQKDGTFKVFARDVSGDLSDMVEVTILPKSAPNPEPTPAPTTSLWGLFIAWIKKLFRMT
jgi:hypothetical protein